MTTAPFTALMTAEAIKLRRSLVWLFALLLPLLAVITGSVNYHGNIDVLREGWASYTSQVTVFYALFFFSVGVALVCAAAWRPEHRGTSWNAMATTSAPVHRIIWAKTLVMAGPVAAMQALLVVFAWASGSLVLGLDGPIPAGFAAASAVAVVAAMPLIALQSLLAMIFKSFGAPVALGLAGTIIGIGISAKAAELAPYWPHALVTRALSLGSTALAGSGGLDWAGIGPVLGAAAVSFVLWSALLTAAARATAARGLA